VNLRRSIQVLARKTPAPVRHWAKQLLVPAFLLRYVYPAPPAGRRAKKRKYQDSAKRPLHPVNYPARAIRYPDGLEIAFRSISTDDFFEDAFVHRTITRTGRKRGRNETRKFFPIPGSLCPVAQAPTGIIFQVGHSGSTLICELLKRIQSVVVYSEPRILSEILIPPHWDSKETAEALRLLGSLFATHASGQYIWKVPGETTLFCEVILNAFPQTPWIFYSLFATRLRLPWPRCKEQSPGSACSVIPAILFFHICSTGTMKALRLSLISPLCTLPVAER
jgi:hypothetical protein